MAIHIGRREFLATLGGAAAAWPLAAHAQQLRKLPHIGVLVSASPPHPFADAFWRGLHSLGYSEGQNIKVEFRYTDGRSDRAAELAAELVRSDVAVIVAHFTPAVRAALAATKTVPIVMAPAGASLQSGFIRSLSDPGGNVTGLSSMDAELGGKRIQLLRDLIPNLACVGVLATTPTRHRVVKRREFITLLGGAAAAWPLAARAQQPAMPVIGFLSSRGLGDSANVLGEFHRGLREGGVVAGQNAAIEYRWAEGRYERLPGLAANLVARQVAVIVATGGDPSALAAKAATATIPIVFSFSDDPVKFGLVTSLNRPGGNATGYSLFVGGDLEAKRFDLLCELVPGAALIAMLVDPNFPVGDLGAASVQSAAQARGLRLLSLRVGADSEFDAAFAQIAAQRAGALLIGSSSFFTSRRDRIAGLAAQYRVPAAYEWREFALAGGLMSYGSRLIDLYHQIGVYAGHVIKGAKPTELPVVRPTKFELVINIKTAKALGLDVPPTLLARADEVIE